jgi:hypothetical protein
MVYFGWDYKREHSLTSATELTDYQVKIRVYRSEGTSTGDTVYLGSKCLADYGDIRFVASDDTTELPYWMETNAGTYADFWVKVGSITSDSCIYIYYGNSSAATTSNGDTTFVFFDDFTNNTFGTKWTLGGSNHKIEDGALQSKYYDASAIPKYVKSTNTFNPNAYALRYRHKGNPPADGVEIIGFYSSDTRWGAVAINPFNGSGDRAWDWSICCDNSPWGTTGGDGTLLTNTYYTIDLYKTSPTNYQAKINDSVIGNVTCTNQDSNHNIGFCAWDSVTSYTFFTDWIFIRSYATTEPTQGAWSEEILNKSYADFESLYNVGEFVSFVSLYFVGELVDFSSKYNIELLVDFVLKYRIEIETAFESIYKIKTDHNFTTCITSNDKKSAEFRTRVSSITGTSVVFEEI